MKPISELVNAEPTEKDYEIIVNAVIEIVQELYATYQFRYYPTKDETKLPYNFVFSFHKGDNPDAYQRAFRTMMESNASIEKIREVFQKKAMNGEVLPLGDGIDIVGFSDEEPLNTGISPINSGVEGEAVTAMLSFVRSEKSNEYWENVKEGDDYSA